MWYILMVQKASAVIHLSFKSINNGFARAISTHPKTIDFLAQRSNINKGGKVFIWSLGPFRPN